MPFERKIEIDFIFNSNLKSIRGQKIFYLFQFGQYQSDLHLSIAPATLELELGMVFQILAAEFALHFKKSNLLDSCDLLKIHVLLTH